MATGILSSGIAVNGQKPHCQAISSERSIASEVAVTLRDGDPNGSRADKSLRRISPSFS